MSNVQIPFETFLNCYKLICLDVGNENIYETTKKSLQGKFEALLRHKLYTEYKTAKSEKEKQYYLDNYLDNLGIPEEYRFKV